MPQMLFDSLLSEGKLAGGGHFFAFWAYRTTVGQLAHAPSPCAFGGGEYRTTSSPTLAMRLMAAMLVRAYDEYRTTSPPTLAMRLDGGSAGAGT